MRSNWSGWSKEETAILIANAGLCTDRELAVLLSRSIGSIDGKLNRMGLASKTKHWTKEETDFLIANSMQMTVDDLAQKLSISTNAVSSKANRLGLKYRSKTVRWSKQDYYKILGLAEAHTVVEIATKMGRTKAAVHRYLTKKGIKLHMGRYSLRGLAQATGYHPSQLFRAKKALGQEWQLARDGHKRCLVTETQMDALTEYLKTETWKTGLKAA